MCTHTAKLGKVGGVRQVTLWGQPQLLPSPMARPPLATPPSSSTWGCGSLLCSPSAPLRLSAQ